MKQLIFCVTISLTVIFFTCGCQKDSLRLSPGPVCFSVEDQRSYRTTKGSLPSTKVLKAERDAEGAPYLIVTESEYDPNLEVCAPSTKGVAVTTGNISTLYGNFVVDAMSGGERYMNGVNVNYTGDGWAVENNADGKPYCWLNEQDITFWSHAPKLGEIADAFKITEITDESMTFDYAYESFEGSARYPYTKDLILAYNKQSSGEVKIGFEHALAAVGAFASPENDRDVKMIACVFENIYTRGTCVYTPGNAAGSHFAWTGSNSDRDGKDDYSRKGFYRSNLGGGANQLNQTNLHFAIPQTLDEDARLVVVLDNDGIEEEHIYSLAGTSWEAGKHYLYRLSYEYPALDATLVEGPTFNQRMRSLSASAKHVVFETGSTVSSGIEVQSASSKGKVYMNWDPETETITVSTPCMNLYSAASATTMFSQMSSVVYIDLSALNTSKTTDMSYMFSNCSSLTSLDLFSFDTGNVTTMSRMFLGCSSLTSLDLSSFDTDNVTDMAYMFFYCSGLTSLDLSSFGTGNVTEMDYMFSNCRSLPSLDLSSFDTGNVTDMSYMFYYCLSLTSLDLSGFDTGNVTTMASMFYYCSSLISLDVSKFNTGKVTTMSYMFADCVNLTSLDVSGFNTSSVTNMRATFGWCRKVAALDVSKWNTENVTDMSWTFFQCYLVNVLDVSGWKTNKAITMNRLFGSTDVASLDLSNFDTSNVTDMDLMFESCPKLYTLDLSSFDTHKVNSYKQFLGSAVKYLILGERFVFNDDVMAKVVSSDITANNKPTFRFIWGGNSSATIKCTEETYNNIKLICSYQTSPELFSWTWVPLEIE